MKPYRRRWTFYSLFLLPIVITLLTVMSCKSQSKKPTAENTAAVQGQTILLADNWLIQSSAVCRETGEIISKPGFDTTGWFHTPVPATVLAALVRNGEYRDIYTDRNLDHIPVDRFQTSWWYRTEINLDSAPEFSDFSHARLIFEGINYRADIWLNGHKIASSGDIAGAFRIFDLDIDNFILPGANILAVEVFPPKPGDFSIGFVDWNPAPPDKSMGLWRPVKLRLTGPVSLENPVVRSKIDLDSLKHASLTVSALLVNHGKKQVSVTVKGDIAEITFSRSFSLAPRAKQEIVFSPDEYTQLQVQNPRLWWPHTLGLPHLYPLKMTVLLDEDGNNSNTAAVISDRGKIFFGIREVADYINKEGYRGYKVNGREVLLRGGGWTDDLLLTGDRARLDSQFRYITHLNLNTLRLEGFWGNDQTLYDLADRYGILVMAGWSCQWEWENLVGKPVDDFGGIQTEGEMDLIAQSLLDQVTWLRHHPSILVWVLGSDKLPRPRLEEKYNQLLDAADPTRPRLASCKQWTSEISGSTAVKMNGPYDYVPPVYWYVDTKHGGAFGFNTETGPGPQPPPLETLKRMLPADRLWPISEAWEYRCARNMFKTLGRYTLALEKRYGKPANGEDFARTAQLVNYEAMRAMFEAFAANKPNTTGIIQWMLNSAWPSMYWQLYDYYLMPSGAFYGAKKANQPLHILYNYGNKSIYIVNDSLTPQENLNAEVQVFNLDSREVFFKTMSVTIGENEAKKIMSLPPLSGLTPVYFVALRLNRMDGRREADNFYWLSQKEDVLNEKGTTWYYTPQKAFADFSPLRGLPTVSLDVRHNLDTRGDDRIIHVTLKNPTDKIAFFIELKVVGEQSGRSFLPVSWEDNYISLLPGESKTLWGKFSTPGSVGGAPVFVFSGWNVK